MLLLIAEHQLLIRVLSVPAGLAVGVLIAHAALRDHHARHRRPAGEVHARPGEMRHHRTATGTYPGTRDLPARQAAVEADAPVAEPAAPHTLTGRDEHGRRYRVANLVGATGEYTDEFLEILGLRPELIGASA